MRFLIVLALVVAPRPANAGGWLQLEAGPAAISSHLSPSARSVTGLGLAADVIRGGRIARHLVLFGQLGGAVMSTPFVYFAGEVDDHWPDSSLLWTIQLGGGALYTSEDGYHGGAALIAQLGGGHADTFDLGTAGVGVSLRGGRAWPRPGRSGHGLTVRFDVLVDPAAFEPGEPHGMTLLLGVFYAVTR